MQCTGHGCSLQVACCSAWKLRQIVHFRLVALLWPPWAHLCHQYHLSVMEEGLELLSYGATCWGPCIISFCMANWRWACVPGCRGYETNKQSRTLVLPTLINALNNSQLLLEGAETIPRLVGSPMRNSHSRIFFSIFPGSQCVPNVFPLGSQCVPQHILQSTSLLSHMLWQMLSSFSPIYMGQRVGSLCFIIEPSI